MSRPGPGDAAQIAILEWVEGIAPAAAADESASAPEEEAAEEKAEETKPESKE